MNILKNILLHIKYGYKANSESYIKFLRKKGIQIGSNTKFYSPNTIQIDTQRPWMIEIGENVHITAGCSILQHGYDWAVLQRKYGEVLGSSGKVVIGNNVFIGQKSTILKGVHIGNNVIIGANSLVNKDCLDEGVYAGNPVRYISNIEDYRNKRRDKQLEEATELVIEYKHRYGKYPPKELLREFFWLFENRQEKLCKTFGDVMKLQNNNEESEKCFKESTPIFCNYNEFLNYIDRKDDECAK